MCAPADYQHWTALKKGEDKRHIWAIRRLETSRRLEILGWRSSRTQTHPPDSGGSAPQMVDEGGVLADIHPYDVYLMGRQQTQAHSRLLLQMLHQRVQAARAGHEGI